MYIIKPLDLMKESFQKKNLTYLLVCLNFGTKTGEILRENLLPNSLLGSSYWFLFDSKLISLVSANLLIFLSQFWFENHSSRPEWKEWSHRSLQFKTNTKYAKNKFVGVFFFYRW